VNVSGLTDDGLKIAVFDTDVVLEKYALNRVEQAALRRAKRKLMNRSGAFIFILVTRHFCCCFIVVQ
jgi:hypothetical protein